MNDASIEETDDQTIILRTPYHHDFVEELKGTVPSSDRQWDPEEKAWTIDMDYEQEVVDLCEHYFDEVEVDRA